LRNIEVKARLRSRLGAEDVAARLSGGEGMILEQKDTYFKVPEGRLKLREEGERAELIFYKRSDESGPRPSDYEIVGVESPDRLTDLLERALGVLAVVSKRRRLHMYGSLRIHIDSVRLLGDFLEFEAVLVEGESEERAKLLVAELLKEFSITPEDLVEESYCDLLCRLPHPGA
jgi:predicted adenylyl cyclase CyaB